MPSRGRRTKWRNILLMLVILPFWTSFLLRVYALSGFLRGEGVINNSSACSASGRWR